MSEDRTTVRPDGQDGRSDPREQTPEQLVRLARAGCRSSFTALVERFEGSLFRFLLARTGDREEAEDLCQEAFLRAFEKLDRYDERWRFSTWLFTIAQRMAVSRARKWRPDYDSERVAEQGTERGRGAAHNHDPAAFLEAAEERDSLWALAAEHCTPDQRTALWLRYAEDVSLEEIARIFERPVTTIRVQLFRARRLLEKKLLEREAARERGFSEIPGFGARTLERAGLRAVPSSATPAHTIAREAAAPFRPASGTHG